MEATMVRKNSTTAKSITMRRNSEKVKSLTLKEKPSVTTATTNSAVLSPPPTSPPPSFLDLTSSVAVLKRPSSPQPIIHKKSIDTSINKPEPVHIVIEPAALPVTKPSVHNDLLLPGLQYYEDSELLPHTDSLTVDSMLLNSSESEDISPSVSPSATLTNHQQYKKHKVLKSATLSKSNSLKENHHLLSASQTSSTTSASPTSSVSSTTTAAAPSSPLSPVQHVQHVMHRHRHVHHHRNYRCHPSEIDGLNESVDDPDSVSDPLPTPIFLLKPTTPFSNFALPEAASSDPEDNTDSVSTEIPARAIISSSSMSHLNKTTSAQLQPKTALPRSKSNESTSTPNKAISSSTNDILIAINNNCDNTIDGFMSRNKHEVEESRSAALGHHMTLNAYRSTPNLAVYNESGEMGSALSLTHSTGNYHLKYESKYPSSLELATNIYDLERKLTQNMHNRVLNRSTSTQLLNNNYYNEQAYKNGQILNANIVGPLDVNSLLRNNITTNNQKFRHRYKLLSEGEVQICKLPHSRNVISKILNSKLLRRWRNHRLVLTDTEIYSTSKSDYMDSSIPYYTITEVSAISKWEPGQKFCLRIATLECHYLIQTNNVYLRDQWIHSIIWKKHKFKSERILRTAVRPEILLREIKQMIDMSTATPLDDSEVYQYPLEIVSELLQAQALPRAAHEEVIVALSPLLERNHPSAEICDFFSRHCRDSPRSHIVIEMFTPVVQRILKHNGDFGRQLRMRNFVQDYLVALISQNAGLQTVQQFVIAMHSTSSQCPFPRVLPNFVSVCLAALHNCFEPHKGFKVKVPPVILKEQEQNDQIVCHATMMYTMSTFEDWRGSLAQLLQSVPFPDQALSNEKFIKIFKKVVRNFAEDERCEVHQTLLGIREGKEGWFESFCPGGISCDDEGELFTVMLGTLIRCCCKKKRFLLSINKLLSQLMIMAVREIPSAIETLCAMLDLDGVENVDNKLQIISTLQTTELGQQMYAKVCERQMQLRELQQKGGPRKLTLPNRSTDEDLAKLLMSGSFGNLECLSLAFTNVTSACAEYIIKLPSLRYLNLWSTKFGDEGLELISEHLTRLQVLNLCETPVTDKGLACLASMKQLRKLNLNSTNLSALTFEALKECLPALQECDIRYTDAW